jgi:hypothetical protein
MKKSRAFFVIIAALALGVSFFIPTDDAHFVWETFTPFSFIFGFAGALLLIVVTKLVIKHLIQRDENYYD